MSNVLLNEFFFNVRLLKYVSKAQIKYDLGKHALVI